VTQRGRNLGRQQQSDPMSVLDQALAETINELDQSGQGVEVEDVVRATSSSERGRGSRSRTVEPERDESGRFLPRQQRRGAPVQDDDADDDDDFSAVFADDDEDEAPAPRRRTAVRRTPVRSVDTDDEEEDDDEDEELEDDPPSTGGRRSRAVADEDEDDDDALDLEGTDEAEDDEDEEQEQRPKKSSRRKRWPKQVKREIDRAVEARVSKVIEERDALRQREQEQKSKESKAVEFLLKAIGTPEERQRLQRIVNDTRQPLAERNKAAALIERYQANEGYARDWQLALQVTNRETEALELKGVREKFLEYGIELDQRILDEGHRAKILVHIAQATIKRERAAHAQEIARYKRALQTAKGIKADRSVRNGVGSRSNGTMASANGRRANGRNPSRAMPRGALTKERGIAADSQVVFPSDEMIRSITQGGKSLADYKIG
jgi:hypothetical protein